MHALVGRNAIGARHEADDLDRLEGGGPRKNRVRPDIADDLGRKREDAAVFVEAGDLTMARQLLDQAEAIFEALGTLDGRSGTRCA